MTIDEFIKNTVGVKWVNRMCSFGALDCWGLVILYYKHVLNIELPSIVGYESNQTSIQIGAIIESRSGRWSRLDKPVNSCVFVAYHSGKPSHVGIVIDNHVLHAKGDDLNGGQVQYNRLDAVTKTCQKMEYYKYDNLSS